MSRNNESSEGEEDVDQCFLDKVLNQLYDFGDGAKCRKNKKLQKKKKKMSHKEEISESDNNDTTTNSEMCNVSDDEKPLNAKDCGQRDLDLTSSKVENSSSATKHSNVQVVLFEDPLKKRKSKPQEEAEPEIKPPEMKKRKAEEDDEEFSIEKARLEVHRFGITGYKKDQQRVFEQDRAIMLGARPPKKEYVNYKTFQQMIKDKKQKEAEEAKMDKSIKRRKEGKSRGSPQHPYDPLMKTEVSPSKHVRDKKQKSSSRGEPSGQVGRFNGGVLVLNPKQLQAMKSKIKK